MTIRKLQAIVEWTDAGVAVRQMEGFEEQTEAGVVVRSMEEFDLPGRTTVKMSFPLPLSPKPVGTVEETFILISAYRCIDCGFETESPDLMKEHQRSGKHTLWQRIRRLVSSFRARAIFGRTTIFLALASKSGGDKGGEVAKGFWV